MSPSTGTQRLFLFFIAVALTGCGASSSPSYEPTDKAYGQPLHVTVNGLPGDQAHLAVETALTDLHFIEAISDPRRPGPLGRTNQLLPMNAEFSANPSVLPLIRHATRLAQASGGYFNPATGRLRELWGPQQPRHTEKSVPSKGAVEALLTQSPQMRDIHIDGIRMRGDNPSLQLDFGPFAQGFAIDTAVARLLEAGAARGRLDNGPFTAVFDKESGGMQNVEVLLPDNHSLTLTLTGMEGLARLDSRRHRFINPYTGAPATPVSVSLVIAETAADAAAAAEALLHIPPGDEEKLLQAMSISHALLLRHGNPLYLTPPMKARLQSPEELERYRMVNGQ